MEMHLVHADKDGNLAVVALMFEEGAENKALAQIWPSIPANVDEKNALASAIHHANNRPIQAINARVILQ